MVLEFRPLLGRVAWTPGLTLALALAVTPPAAAQGPPRYYTITDLGPGEAQKIQNLGLGFTIGSLQLSSLCPGFPGDRFGFMWEGGTNKRTSFCPRLDDASSGVFDFKLSGLRSAVGYSRSVAGVDRPVIWEWQPDNSFLPRLLPVQAGGAVGVAWGIEPLGQVVGELAVGGERRAAYWMTPSAAPSVFPAAGTSAAFTISGSIFDPAVGGQHDGRFALWYARRNPSLVTYPLGEAPSVGFRVRQDGSVLRAVGQTTTGSGSRAFLWQSDSGVTLLASLAFGNEAGARDFWTSGRIVGFSHNFLGQSRAVLWEGIFPLDLDELKMPTCRNDDPIACAPWTLETASSISQAGTIVGSGTLDGEPHAFLARPVELLIWNANVCAVTQQPFCVAQPSKISNELIIDPFEVKDQQPPKSASAANAYAAGAKAYVENNGIWIPNASSSFRSYVVFEPRSVMDALLPGQTSLDVRFHFKMDGLTAGSSSPNTTGSVTASMALRPARNAGVYSSAGGSLTTNNGVTQRTGVFAGQGAGSEGDIELPLLLQPFGSNPLEARIEGSFSAHTLASGPTWASAEGSVRFCSEDPRSITRFDGTPLANLGIKYTMWPTVRREEDEEDPCRNPVKDLVNESPVCEIPGPTGEASFRIVSPDVVVAGEQVELVGVARPVGGTLTATVVSGNATIESQRPCTTYPDGNAHCPVVVRAPADLAPEAVVVVRLTYSYNNGESPCVLESTAILVGSRLQFVDPNDLSKAPKLIDTFAPLTSQPVEFLRRDAGLMSKEGRGVRGLASDGITPVILRLRAPGPGTATFTVADERGSRDPANAGRLADPFATTVTYTNPLTVPTWQVGNDHWAFAVLTSPLDFVRPDVPADTERGYRRPRRLPVQVDFAPAGGGAQTRVTRSLDLVRPPLALMHGIWSEAAAWETKGDEYSWPLRQDGDRFFHHPYDYGSASGKSFLENYQRGRLATDKTLELFRRERLAATQVDVLAHSMGGNLFRIYIGGPAYGQNRGLSPAQVRAKAPVYKEHVNYGAGTVHKLIIFDSPQLGSPLGNWMHDRPLVRFLYWLFKDKRALGGAADDLRREGPTSDAAAIMAQPSIQVPTHAMKGGLGGLYLQLLAADQRLLRVFNALIPGDVPSYLQGLYAPEPDHDVIVGVCSQQAGLPPGPSVGYASDDPNQSMHLKNRRSFDYNNEAVELLNAPVGSSVFASGLVKPQSGVLCGTLVEQAAASPLAPPSPDADAKAAALPTLLEGGLVITSPAAGTVVVAGSTIAVTVEAAGGFAPDRVLVGAGAGAELAFASGFDGTVTIPETEYGDIELQAVGIDAQEEVATALPVVIHVQAPAPLTGLAALYDKVVLTAASQSISLGVSGTFADGVTRDLTSPGTGTTYESLDTTVATVDAEGVVTAVKGGTTLLRTANGGFETITEVRVTSTPSDADGDGDVDLADFLELRACWSGAGDDPEFQPPSNSCRDTFDADQDGDVDEADYPPFLARYTAPLADCNVNAVPDLTDIVDATSLDADGNGVPDECGG